MPPHAKALPLACLAVSACALSAAAQAPPAKVTVAPIVERDLPNSIKLVGTVLPERQAVVAAEVAGVVAEYAADEGDYLEQGQPICRLDSTVIGLKLAEERDKLGSLRAELAERENGTRKEVLAQLQASMGEAQAMYDMWKFERERVADLFSQNQSSPKEKHDTEMEYLAAERRLAQSKAAYEAAVNGPRVEEIDRYRHDVAAQEQVVKQLERDFDKTTVRAPFAGFIVAKRTEVGEWIEAGGPAAELVALDKVKIRADAPEAAVPYARPKTAASVEIEALHETRTGVVARVIPRANEAARTFPVEIDLDNADHTLLPGMFVWANVPAGQSGKRLMAPKDAIVPRGLEKHLFVIRPGEKGSSMAIPMSVETGLELGDEVEVRAKGLQAGDQVVTRANERLLPFMPNAVIPIANAASPTTNKSDAADTADAPEQPASQPAGDNGEPHQPDQAAKQE